MRYVISFLGLLVLLAAVGCGGSATQPIVTAPPGAGPTTDQGLKAPPPPSPPPKKSE